MKLSSKNVTVEKLLELRRLDWRMWNTMKLYKQLSHTTQLPRDWSIETREIATAIIKIADKWMSADNIQMCVESDILLGCTQRRFERTLQRLVEGGMIKVKYDSDDLGVRIEETKKRLPRVDITDREHILRNQIAIMEHLRKL